MKLKYNFLMLSNSNNNKNSTFRPTPNNLQEIRKITTTISSKGVINCYIEKEDSFALRFAFRPTYFSVFMCQWNIRWHTFPIYAFPFTFFLINFQALHPGNVHSHTHTTTYKPSSSQPISSIPAADMSAFSLITQ